MELLFKKLLLLIRFDADSLPVNREVVLVEKEVVEPVTLLLLSSSKGLLTLLELLMLVVVLLLILLMLRLKGSSSWCCDSDWKLLKSINWLVGGATIADSLELSNGSSAVTSAGSTGTGSASSKCVRNFASTEVGGLGVYAVRGV